MDSTTTAYVTGGASGIGRAVVKLLVNRGVKTVIADINLSAAQTYAEELNSEGGRTLAVQVDIAGWDSQLAAFKSALAYTNGRIDLVFAIAGIGERSWLPPFDSEVESHGSFVKPDLTVLNTDLGGTLHTVALAVQQMRRQSPDDGHCRGRIAVAASVCGFYAVPTLPVYTAAKYGLVGFVRSYGALLLQQGITLNAVCPHVVRTSISKEDFYEKVDQKGLLAGMEAVVAAFEHCTFGPDLKSGECLEVGPKTDAFTAREVPAFLDRESEELCEMLYDRGMPLHVKAPGI